MTNLTHLERSYRRLLAFFPRAFRQEHEQEMLTVLMAGIAEGQRRPRFGEALDLLRNAIFMRLRRIQLPSSWEYRHARVMVPVRIATGTWLLVLTAIMYGTGHGGWWGALLLPFAALHFYLVYRVTRPVKG
jgi:hypothetical protein